MEFEKKKEMAETQDKIAETAETEKDKIADTAETEKEEIADTAMEEFTETARQHGKNTAYREPVYREVYGKPGLQRAKRL